MNTSGNVQQTSSNKTPTVDATCIGCCICPNVANNTFVMVETSDGLKSVVTDPHGNKESEIQQAIDICPVTAIHWQEIAKKVQKDLRN